MLLRKFYWPLERIKPAYSTPTNKPLNIQNMSTTVDLAYWRSTRCSRWAEELRCIVSGCHRSAGLPRPATIPHFMRRPLGFIASWRYLSLKNMLYMSTESSSVPWVDRFKITVSIVGPKIERSLLSVPLCLYVPVTTVWISYTSK